MPQVTLLKASALTPITDELADVAAAQVPIGGEILWPVANPFPGGDWVDTGARLLSGASERAILVRDPAPTLFADGTQGAWFDPSDLSTLFTDTAGTIPATVGSAVARMNDKSGRGHHAVQAVVASRPILQQDASGHYYLEGDGIDDWLQTDAIDLSAGLVTTMMAAFETATPFSINSPVMQYRAIVGTSATDPAFRIVTGDGALDAVRVQAIGAAASQSNRLAVTSPHKGLYTYRFDASLTGIPEIDLRRDGVFISDGSPTDSGVTAFTSAPLAIGAMVGGGRSFRGKFYGGLFIGKYLAGNDLTNAEAYLAAKSGVTI